MDTPQHSNTISIFGREVNKKWLLTGLIIVALIIVLYFMSNKVKSYFGKDKLQTKKKKSKKAKAPKPSADTDSDSDSDSEDESDSAKNATTKADAAKADTAKADTAKEVESLIHELASG